MASSLGRTNGGVNWTTVGCSDYGDRSVMRRFPLPADGYAIDAIGGAFRTVNGGCQLADPLTRVFGRRRQPCWRPIPTPSLLVGPTGVRRSTDGGGTFGDGDDKDVKKARLNQRQAGGRRNPRLRAPKPLCVSTNSGADVEEGRTAEEDRRSSTPSFVSAQRGFILTRHHTSCCGPRTEVAGWTTVSAIGTAKGYAISFSSLASGFVSVQNPSGLVLHTTDGGASWQPQLISSTPLRDLWDAGPTAFALTSAGSFFNTNSGGQAATPTTLTLKQKGGPKAKRAAKAAKVKVAGTLSPAEGGEQVTVSYRNGEKWRSRTVTAASNGQFTSSFTVKKPTVAVAQWLGDDTRAGAGSQGGFGQAAQEEAPQVTDRDRGSRFTRYVSLTSRSLSGSRLMSARGAQIGRRARLGGENLSVVWPVYAGPIQLEFQTLIDFDHARRVHRTSALRLRRQPAECRPAFLRQTAAGFSERQRLAADPAELRAPAERLRDELGALPFADVVRAVKAGEGDPRESVPDQCLSPDRRSAGTPG